MNPDGGKLVGIFFTGQQFIPGNELEREFQLA
jgi:hypothetical protein